MNVWQSGVRECLGSNKDNASSNHSSHGWSLKYPFPKGMWRTINEDMCHCAERKKTGEEANNKWKRIAWKILTMKLEIEQQLTFKRDHLEDFHITDKKKKNI